jgi:hypothetical protein
MGDDGTNVGAEAFKRDTFFNGEGRAELRESWDGGSGVFGSFANCNPYITIGFVN